MFLTYLFVSGFEHHSESPLSQHLSLDVSVHTKLLLMCENRF